MILSMINVFKLHNEIHCLVWLFVGDKFLSGQSKRWNEAEEDIIPQTQRKEWEQKNLLTFFPKRLHKNLYEKQNV